MFLVYKERIVRALFFVCLLCPTFYYCQLSTFFTNYYLPQRIHWSSPVKYQ